MPCSEGAAAQLKGPWLADVVAALLVRASEVGEGALPEQEGAWRATFDALHLLIIGHLQVLQVRKNSSVMSRQGMNECTMILASMVTAMTSANCVRSPH